MEGIGSQNQPADPGAQKILRAILFPESVSLPDAALDQVPVSGFSDPAFGDRNQDPHRVRAPLLPGTGCHEHNPERVKRKKNPCEKDHRSIFYYTNVLLSGMYFLSLLLVDDGLDPGEQITKIPICPQPT